jgi:hypothetical protein
MKTLFTIVIIVLLVAGFTFIKSGAPVGKATPVQTTPINQTTEDYVRQNISSLSSVKEQVGGTFYVTAIETHGGTGTVHYEDGHNAYSADFTYDVDHNGSTTITSFTLRN